VHTVSEAISLAWFSDRGPVGPRRGPLTIHARCPRASASRGVLAEHGASYPGSRAGPTGTRESFDAVWVELIEILPPEILVRRLTLEQRLAGPTPSGLRSSKSSPASCATDGGYSFPVSYTRYFPRFIPSASYARCAGKFSCST
jgi:hypothetical protein